MTPLADINYVQFRKMIVRRGFSIKNGVVSHPEIRNGSPLCYSLCSWRQGVQDLCVQLREARAVARGARFVTTRNANGRLQGMVAA